MIGKTLSHFSINAKLGSGGMGEVYRATDESLAREVALKVLPPDMAGDADRLARFRREARAVAALNHPNIVTLHSIEEEDGVHFLILELVEGHTLAEEVTDQGLKMQRLLALAVPIAQAVAAAHAKGITHRDLKPANVMITPDDRVKVLDFGLAKLTEQPSSAELTLMQTQEATRDGIILGTVPYMSPEQVEGKPLGPPSDVFSLGVLLYEMATGTRPFQGETNPALMSSILRDTPRPIRELRDDLPESLGHVLSRCLEKDSTVRYDTAGPLADVLETLRRDVESGATTNAPKIETSAGKPQQKSVAVLPFINRSGNPDDDYFSDGLSEELINGLGKLHHLKVSARGSSFQFRGQEIDVRDVGEKLGVDNVLEGSVRMAGDRLRITVQLVSCADGYQHWSERFDTRMEDVFDTQDEIAQAIVEKLEVEMGDRVAEAPLIKKGTDNLEAYQLLLRSRQARRTWSGPGFLEAIGLLERAIVLDPDFADAYAELGLSWSHASAYGYLPDKEAFRHLQSNVQRALELDPESAPARTMSAQIHAVLLDFRGALEEAQKAFASNPQYVEGYFAVAWNAAASRRHAECISAAQKALDLDPLEPYTRGYASLYLFLGNDDVAAEKTCQQSLELFPEEISVHWTLALVYWKRRQQAAALASSVRALELGGTSSALFVGYASAIHFYFGETSKAERLLASAEELGQASGGSRQWLAVLEIARGRTDEAIALLENLVSERDLGFPVVRPICENLGIIEDERIRDAMDRLGLP